MMIRILFSPYGRLSRGGMWLWSFLIPLVAQVATALVDMQMGLSSNIASFSNTFLLLYLWPSLVALPVKRFHDLGISGWAYFVLIVLYSLGLFSIFIVVTSGGLFFNPSAHIVTSWFAEISTLWESFPDLLRWISISGIFIIGIVLFWLTLVSPGQPGENRYGSDPLER